MNAAQVMNLGRLLTHTARLFPDRPALIHEGGRTWTWREMELRVAAMDKTYTRLTEETNAPAGADQPAQSRGVQTAFESVSKQIAEQTLGGLTPTRVEYVDLNDVRNLCAMINIDKPQTRQVYDQIVQTAGAKLAPETSEALYKDVSTPSN